MGALTLAVERRDGRPVLVCITDQKLPGIVIATFIDDLAAALYVQANNLSMMFSREMGRSGI